MKKLLVLFILACLAPPVGAEEFSLVNTVGTGTDTDPIRAENCPSASPKIQLGATGKWVCRSATLPSKAIALAQTTSEPLSTKSKTDAGTALGKTVDATSVTDLLKKELIDTGIVQPSKDGKLKIYFGSQELLYQKTAWVPFEDHGLVADLWNRQKDAANLVYRYTLEPAIAWAVTLATETFTNSDGDLGGRTHVHAWTEHAGTGWTITSNEAFIDANAQSEAWMGSALDTDDHTVTVTLVSLEANAALTRCGPTGRNPGTATRTHYAFAADANTAGAEFNLYRRVAGAFTSLATNAQDPVNGDTIQIILDGTTYEGKVNGVTLIGPTTDGSPITGNLYAGIAFNSSAGTGKICRLDNLIAADIAVPVSAFGQQRRMR